MLDMITNNRLFRNLFDSQIMSDLLTSNDHFGFNLDIKEFDNNYEFIIEVPGIQKDDIYIQMKYDIISITVDKLDDIDEDYFDFIRNERKFGSMTRSFQIPDVSGDDISAICEDGILRIHLPKSDVAYEQIKTIIVE